jgi:hypothetical protein
LALNGVSESFSSGDFELVEELRDYFDRRIPELGEYVGLEYRTP